MDLLEFLEDKQFSEAEIKSYIIQIADSIERLHHVYITLQLVIMIIIVRYNS